MSVEVRVGDCRELLRVMPNQSVHCCVTSPPYFGLRDYGHAGQIGMEPTPEEYIAAMVEVFRCVRDVLTDDGTLWLNIGDSYAGAGYSNHKNTGGAQRDDGGKQRHLLGTGCKPKDLIGIPWMLAFALRADGWYLRQDIIWHKPNPMPESVRDRCTKAHEYVFLLSKSERYFFDSEAMKEPADPANHRDSPGVRRTAPGSADHSGFKDGRHYETRNKRSVWTVATQPYDGAHFATYPPALIEPCVLAGCPTGGTVLDPFGGAGTTGLVADRLGRNAVLCELNPEYAQLARNRIFDDAPLFADVA